MDSAICLAFVAACASTAAASPYVAYVGNVSVHSPSPGAKVMVVDLATGETANLSRGLHSARQPAWAPDSPRVAFEAIEDGLSDIFVANADGSNRTNVTQSPDVWESAPAFVDEDVVAYLEGPDRTHLVLRNLGTGEATRLTTEPRFHSRPVASPDGGSIAIAGSEKLAGPGRIYLIDVGTGEARELTAEPAVYSEPCFSPEGGLVAFAFDGREIGGATRGLAIIPTDAGEATLLTTDGYPYAPVSFSADGSTLAYTSCSQYHSTWVQTVGIDGGDPTRLDAGHFHVCGWPSFGPGGTSIAYQGVYAAKYGVYVLDLATGEAERVTPEGETGVTPAFSPK